MKIYTKTGDKGSTSLLSGNRVPKYHLRIESYGTVDELNAHVGLLRSYDLDAESKSALIRIQNLLFNIGSSLAMDENQGEFEIPQIKDAHIFFLEYEIDQMELELPKLSDFVLQGGHFVVAQSHICRTVCRRLERLVVQLAADENENLEQIIMFLNRLSDYFFVFSRKQAKYFDTKEEKWNKEA